MIYDTEGYISSYHGGLNLSIIIYGALLTAKLYEILIFSLLTCIIYVFFCSLHPNFEYYDLGIFYSNLYFIVLTSIIATATSILNYKRQFNEFKLKHELEIQNQQLTLLDQAKSRFIANISHEFRTPLTLILAPVTDLKKFIHQIPSKQRHSIHLIEENAYRLQKLVDDLLDIIKLDESQYEIKLYPININSFLNSLLTSMGNLAESKKIKLINKICDDTAFIDANEANLEKIFINLLSNAIKFTSSGGTIEIYSFVEKENIIIEVRDTGIGIHQKDLP